ncbi:MAG: AzlD domain-containing protein [Limnochordia bacterium]
MLLRWLSFIPVAVLGALLGPELLLRRRKAELFLWQSPSPGRAAQLHRRGERPAACLWTVVAGMGAVVLLRSL